MSKSPRISSAEWQVMDLVWAKHPQSAGDVARALAPQQDWSEATVKTLLSRLVKKGALKFEREGKRYLYSPAVGREACVRDEAKSFADRVFGGKSSPMLSWFVEEAPLTDEEIEELQQLLARKKQAQEDES